MRYLILCLTVLQFLLSAPAQAYKCTAASDFTISVPTLYTNPDLSFGYEPIGETYTTASKPLITCTDTSYIETMKIDFFTNGYFYPGEATPDGNQLFLGSLSGNSAIVYNVGADASCGTSSWLPPGNVRLLEVCPSTVFASVTPKVKFYQKYTGEAIPSSVTKTAIGAFWVKINNQTAFSVPAYFSAFNVISSPCKVTTKSVSIPMGNIPTARFTDVLSTAGGADFNISLQCTQATKVTLQIDPNGTSPSKPLGLIPINTGTDAAKGIAIQLFNNQTNNFFRVGSPVTLSDAEKGNYNISLKATYAQIEDTIVPGTANGSATFTVRYQ